MSTRSASNQAAASFKEVVSIPLRGRCNVNAELNADYLNQPLFPSPCGEDVMSTWGSTLMFETTATVSIPLRGRCNVNLYIPEKGDTLLPAFPSPCGEDVMSTSIV